MKKYYLKVNGKQVEVNEQVYSAYYKEYEHERYLKQLSAEHESSFEMLAESGYQIEMHMKNKADSTEEQFISNETWQEIQRCLELLTPYERELIVEHYLYDVQQLILAKRNGKSRQAINQNINRILRKLKKMQKF